jgi:flagellar hook protein FlgE
MYNSSTSTTIYDSLGNPHVATLFFSKTATAGTWDVHGIVDGGSYNAGKVLGVTATTPQTATAMTWAAGAVTVTAPGAYAIGDTVTIAGVTPAGYNGTYSVTSVGAGSFTYALATDPGAVTVQGTASEITNNLNLVFGTSGQLTAPPGPPIGQFTAEALGWTDPGVAAQKLGLNFNGTTQFGSPFGVNALTQDGFASGRLAGFSIGSDGIVQKRYTNGQINTLGQIALANFANPQGLQPLGDNQWTESPASGQALVGAPGTSSLGMLQSGAIEESNVDLTAELVNMIVAQRAYQANAQTIKTQDAVLQTLVNLR